MNQEKTLIYGRHAVAEALSSRPDLVTHVWLQDGARDPAFDALLRSAQIRPHAFLSGKPPKGVSTDAVHQGIIAEIAVSGLLKQYDAFINELSITNDTALIILGEVQDPHNVGAVIRSAAAFGVAGVLIPGHRQAQVSGTVIKVSAGMAFQVPLVSIGNVNQTIHDLKERGFWVYGLAGTATQSVHEEGFEKPSVIVLGNEADGIREKTLEHCDIALRIPMHERAESLNASVAAAVVLFAWSARHPRALK